MKLHGLAIGGLTLCGALAWSSTSQATNRYVINSFKTPAQAKLSLRAPSKTSVYTPSYGELEWGTHFQSTVTPRAAVTLTCNDSGWRAWSLGPVSYGSQPSGWSRTATQVTAEVPAPFYNAKGLYKAAIEQWCPAAIASDIWKVKAADRNKGRTVSVFKSWKMRVGGKCIRTKWPSVGKVQNVYATKAVQVEVRCSYNPSSALKDNEPLKLYWSGSRQDNFTPRSPAGETAAKAAKYGHVRTEARTLVFHAGGSHSLNLYWNGANNDNLSTTPFFKAPAGYNLVRKQGYVYASPKSFTKPLKLYWSAARKDYFTTGTAQGEAAAKAAGYKLVKVLGHAVPQK